MMRWLTMLAAASLAAAVWAAPPASPAATAPSFDDYQLILDRNMFSRERSSGRSRSGPSFTRTGPMSRPAPAKYDFALVLTGVVEQDGLDVAFIEDTRTGETFRVTAGTAIAGGVLKSVSMEGVEFGEGENVKKFAVGESITGVSGGTSRPSVSASGPGDSSVNDILERMRLRRLQETK